MTDKIISIFSIQSSMKIFKSYRPSSNLNIFNGIKTFAMFWVILSHQYFFNLQVVVNSLTFFSSLLHPYYLFIQAGMLSVDIFLFLGGFFVASMIVKDKNFTLLKIPYIIFNRLLRFWPSYIVSLLIFCGVLEYLGSGPYWFFINYQTMPCSHWWRSIFFLDNLIDNGK